MLRIYGTSDDIVIWGNDNNSDEIDCYDQDVEFTIIDNNLEKKMGIVVTVIYGNKGCWSVKFDMLDEDVLCPWDVNVKMQGYSVVAEINCPEDVKFSHRTIEKG